MKTILKLAVLVAAPLLMAALWMDDQPSYKPYEAPLLAPPASAVPVHGRENVPRDRELKNPQAPDEASLARGSNLFDINCAMCHGRTSGEQGPVGRKLSPPPPGLDQAMVKKLTDSAIFKAITFGFGRMPQFRERLTPAERWSLVNFLRSRK